MLGRILQGRANDPSADLGVSFSKLANYAVFATQTRHQDESRTAGGQQRNGHFGIAPTDLMIAKNDARRSSNRTNRG